MLDPPNWMVSRTELKDRFPLDVQSRGRELTADEQALADALEAIFSKGIHDMEAVASELTAAAVPPPDSGAEWTAESLAQRLAAINAEIDKAFEENGYGA